MFRVRDLVNTTTTTTTTTTTREHGFAACGDYFTPFSGRVEGAWLSGSSLADELLAGTSLQQP